MGEEIKRPSSKRQKRAEVFTERLVVNYCDALDQHVDELTMNHHVLNDATEQTSPSLSSSDENRPHACNKPPSQSNAEQLPRSTQRRRLFVDQLDQILQVFRQNETELDDEHFTLEKNEFQKIQNLYLQFLSRFPQPFKVVWICESGHSSVSKHEQSEGSSIAAYVQAAGKKQVILGKFSIQDPVKRLVIPKPSHVLQDEQLNLDSLTVNLIKQNYRPPPMFIPLNEVLVSVTSNVYGVVTAINKLPLKEVNKSRWHSLICITDPTLQPDENSNPLEFKLHTFFVFDSDFPELHVGDVVRVQNMKVESHQDRKDGRIFKPEDLSVFCNWDWTSPLPHEMREPHHRTIRLLTRWWHKSEIHFNPSTPRPCYTTNYPFLGIRTLQEISDGLVFSLYCQVIAPFTSGNFYGLAVRDGTVFTLEDNSTCVSSAPWQRRADRAADPCELQHCRSYDLTEDLRRRKQHFLNRPFGYIALMLYTEDQRRELQYLGIKTGDFLMIHHVTAKFLDKRILRETSSNYPFQSPCVVLALSTPRVSDSVAKLASSHHEAYKIERRLRKLPDVLESMAQWQVRQEESPPPRGDLLEKLSDRNVQVNFLQNICIL